MTAVRSVNILLDTTALEAVYMLKLSAKLKTIYNDILIPVAVNREFTAVNDISEKALRTNFLDIAFTEKELTSCQDYDLNEANSLTEQFNNVSKTTKIHYGEAELITQYKTIRSLEQDYTIIIDDAAARKYCQNEALDFHGTLWLLSNIALSLALGYDVYNSWIMHLVDSKKRFKPALATAIYEQLAAAFNT